MGANVRYMDRALLALRLRIAPLACVVEKFVASLPAPQLMKYSGGHGFRYDNPDVKHLCLAKAARVVSGLHACVELTRSGYTQEIGTIARTVIECATHIEFVLDLNGTEKHKKLVKEYLEAFFADSEREAGVPAKKAHIPQGVISDMLGQTLDEIAEAVSEGDGRTPAATLYRSIYGTFSNYVHAKYPECMDLYGGTPGHFHLRGMADTPKDQENVEQIATHIETACNTFVIMIQQLDLRELMREDAVVDTWYRERMGNQ